MFDPREIGTITPDEQADALRTLIAVFATCVVRPGSSRPRNAISAEILDILDDVPGDRTASVAQLFAMMAMRLRRRSPPRHTILRLVMETALLTRKHAGGNPPESEAAYLTSRRPGLTAIDGACDDLLTRMAAVPEADVPAWLAAQSIAVALVNADREVGVGAQAADVLDLTVVEFLLRTAGQYLAATADRRRPKADDNC